MHTRTIGVALAVACTLALAGCDSDDKNTVSTPNKPTIIDKSITEPPGGPAPTAPGKPAAPTSAKPSAPPPAKVGDTLTLTDGDGAPMDVTLVKLVDPATPASTYFKPKAGSRWIAIQWKITNKGQAPIDDTPGGSGHIIDDQGQQFGNTFGETSSGPAFPSAVSIPPGESRLGYETYEIPEASKVASIQLQTGNILHNVTGEWKPAAS